MSWNDAKDWWKAPVLQGPENDYGDYDYLIEEIPENNSEWIFGAHRCESCGKTRHAIHRSTEYFRTMDGYDSLSYDECWICTMKLRFCAPFRRLHRKLKPARYFFRCLRSEIKLRRNIIAQCGGADAMLWYRKWNAEHKLLPSSWEYAKLMAKVR